MILQKLRLRNFGVYQGEHELELAPSNARRRRRNVILIGGVNGSGKSTILDSILLTLYGPRAKCSKIADCSYDEFLARMINGAAASRDYAATTLVFTLTENGLTNTYEVTRSWSMKKGKARERLSVIRDGKPDAYLTQNWGQIVDDLIPIGLSELFFFDAERIRLLAEDKTTSEILRASIRSLLGLELVERLVADLQVVTKKQKIQDLDAEKRKKAEELHAKAEQITSQLDEVRRQLASERNVSLRGENALKKAEQEFASKGGGLAEKRERLLKREAELSAMRDQMIKSMQELVAGPLPLALVEDLLKRVHRRVEKESEAKYGDAVAKALKKRDRRILSHLKKLGAKRVLIGGVKEFLQLDARQRAQSESESSSRLGISDRGSRQVEWMMDEGIGSLRDRAAQLTRDQEQLLHELENVQRSANLAPDDKALTAVTKKLSMASGEAAASRERIRRLETQTAELDRDLAAVNQQLSRLLEGLADAESRSEDAERIVALAKRTQTVMDRFLKESTARKIEQLAGSITESFLHLLRKGTLAKRICVNPESFEITVLNQEGQEVLKSALSDGEKQIFAISVLWGLARASRRPLPAIIDTPLARLDARHRSLLVDRYFPHASHQVLILSTDTEVDLQYYRSLSPHIARAYHLNYDEESRSTNISEGYFWKDSELVAARDSRI